MNTVSDILIRKNRPIIAVEPTTTVYDAIKLMAENNIGSVLVIENNRFLGIVTERDYSRKIILKGKSSTDTNVTDIMITDLPAVKEEDTVEYCMHLLSNSNLRYLPVFEKDQLRGIISITDVIKQMLIIQQETIDHLNNYINS